MPQPQLSAGHLSRRNFLQLWSLATAATLCDPRAFGQARVPQSRLASDTMRPQFHLMPARGWMNDPNGPIYAHGRYHIFCQHNPEAAVWGNMSWAHMVSDDMIHWRHLPLAIAPTPNSIDSYGIFSGSCLIVGKRVYAVYTATELSDAAHATTRGKPNFRESQRLAWSDDPMLLHWTKEPDAIVPTPPADLHEVTGFRDPSIWQQGGVYYMTVGAGESGKGGCVLIYSSRDLKRWSYLHKFAEGEWHGTVQDDKVASGEMWECPDFFALDGGHVLIYSTEGKVYWQSGKLDTETMRFQASKTGVLDLGTYYAPKTQLDAHGNRILWGWIPERRPESDTVAAGWAGVMSLPRVLHLDADGTLRMDTLPTLQALRGAPVSVSTSNLTQRVRLPKSNGEILATPAPRVNAQCIVRNAADNTEIAAVHYDSATHRFHAGDQSFELHATDTADIHLFADGSVLEFILGHRAGCTRRFYLPNAPDLLIEMSGVAKAAAWPLRPISPDRLTTLPQA
ncbi:beta-fructosidase, levanase/invertase [Terriglobus roseus DSM 18391]|uniref:beta-fructofuranosidase n=1 Tax=Terriglobus roseus (strain DSM 18391 / NRRL B-41598 / KBS 63) TaxID=926566 RepID=I3ZHX2_TERRK|nr:glycoside hydrolase family 32 protein [Terriglobus roseus]AFL88500.1 beta-fructosidase, levanase/invertase [Terriglobus roseus DSM 18391]AFL88840.1 beta-fructosidase, levanase/invertase [Terriglobus roseus DSM 18391]